MISDASPGLRIGDLAALVDAHAATDLARTAGLDVVSLRPTYLRLKPGESAIVGYDAHTWGQTSPVQFHARTFDSKDRAETLAAKWAAKPVDDTFLAPGVAVSPSGSSVLFAFPNDNDLHGLRHVASARGWRRLLPDLPRVGAMGLSHRDLEITPVRYKPGRRVVGRVTGSMTATGDHDTRQLDAYFRWFGDDRGNWIARLSTAAHSAGIPVPHPIDVSGDGRLVLEERLEGIDGTTAIVNGLIDLDQLSASIRSLHQLPVASAPGSAVTDLDEALAALDTIALIEPRLATPALQLAIHLRRLDEPDIALATIHGDLHLGQLVVVSGRAHLVDLERARSGQPHSDIASLAAHLLELELDGAATGRSAPVDALRHAWAAAGGDADDAVGVPLACALVRRALLALRSFDPRWPALGEHLLARAADTIASPRWRVIHARPSGHWTAQRTEADRMITGRLDGSGTWHDVVPTQDDNLPGLSDAIDRGALVSYRPGRRAVVRTTSSFVKVVPPRRAQPLVDRLETVRPLLPPQLRVPEVVAIDTARGIVELESMSGRSFHEVLMEGSASERTAAIHLAGELVAAFGALDTTHVELPSATDGGSVRAWAETIGAIHPSLLVVHLPVVDEVEQLEVRHLSDRPTRLVHGDLHDRNLLLGDGSGALIDLDSVGLGDPSIDLGNLGAHLVLRALQRGDAPAVGRHDAERLLRAADGDAAAQVHLVRTLCRLSCVYRFRARWASLATPLLDEAAGWARDLG
ncbi:MAG: phosphotransferase [Ilumatobacteraceae bacterium]